MHPTRMAFTVAVMLAAATGCKRGGPATTGFHSPDGGSTAEMAVGPNDDQPRLTFTIAKVYRGQRLADSPPWHAPGGDWTFFDAQLTGEPSIPFTVGVSASSAGSTGIAFSRATIVSSDADSGSRFVERFAAAFHTPPPPARTRSPLQAIPFDTAILGEGTRRDLSTPGGGWTASKWFLQDEGLEAEVFFNYDLTDHLGEFAEKDEDYRRDLLAALALHLRDGPTPDRTPATDPRLTEIGPHAGEFHPVGSSRATFFSWQDSALLFEDSADGAGKSVYSLLPQAPDKAVELVHVEHRLDGMKCAGEHSSGGCLVQEAVPDDPRVWSSADPVVFWWIAHGGDPKVSVTGAWDDKHLAATTSPVSPDGHYLALAGWKKRASGKGADRIVHFVDRTAPNSDQVFSIPGQSVDIVRWTRNGTRVTAIARVGSLLDRSPNARIVAVDPSTAVTVEGATPAAADDSLSRDGKYRCAFRAGGSELAITRTADGTTRVFAIHPDDVRFTSEATCAWAGARHVRVPAARLGLVNVETLKMSYPVPRDHEHSYEFSPDMMWIVRSGKDGMALAKLSAQ